MKIRISEINVNPRLRGAAPEKVAELADSIEASGLLNPITVNQEYTLIAGLHRLEAVKQLGWLEVECTVCDLEGLKAVLAEIDENMVRNELTHIERCNMLLRRKEVYEALHPPNAHGGDRRSEDFKVAQCDFENIPSFVDDTAAKLGLHRSTVMRDLQIAKNLTPEAKQTIQGSGRDIKKKEALKLSRLPPEQQGDAARQLVAASSTGDSGKPPPKPSPPPKHPAPKSKEPEEPSQDAPDAAPPFLLPVRHFDSFADSVAFLKDPEKDCTCTPDIFLADFTEFVKKINREIEWYNDPYYAPAFPGLTGEQLRYLRQQIDSITAAWDTFYHHIERECHCEQQA